MCPGFYRGAYATIYVINKNASPPGHVFKTTGTILELVREIIETHCLTKFHEDRTINVASKVKNAPPLGANVFQPTRTIFELAQDIIGTHLLTKTIFLLVQDIIGTNVLTKFHEDWTIYVASKVLSRQMLTPHNTLRMTDKR
ncbi:hypothetical protein DPMN_084067 [Dreissena polymorpha]|uniref:Uncharacterized protein n=1 Tax=Dreissena polymorpha TaxID=45954 RepID=A0A9D4BBP9_DREPO|nr:hypothetical protein DPMN_084067 [Dreissena polymorpha]